MDGDAGDYCPGLLGRSVAGTARLEGRAVAGSLAGISGKHSKPCEEYELGNFKGSFIWAGMITRVMLGGE